MIPKHSWYIAANVALAGAIAIQFAAQLVAAEAMTAAASGAHSRDSLVADRLFLVGMILAGAGVGLWLVSALKHQTPTHTIPIVLIALYALLLFLLV